MAEETLADLLIKISAVQAPEMQARLEEAAALVTQALKQQEREEQSSAQRKERLEQDLQVKIIGLVDGRVAAQKLALEQEVAALKAAKVSEEQVEQYHAAALKKIDDEVAANAERARQQNLAAEKRAADQRVAVARDEVQKRAAEETHLQQLRENAYRSLQSIGGVAKGLAGDFIGAAAEMQTFQMRLEAVTHSSEQATNVLAAANEMAKRAPFTFESIAKGAVSLTVFGQNAQEWLPKVGNLAASMGVDFDYAAAVIGRALMGDHMALRSLHHELGISNEMLKKYGATISDQGMVVTHGADNLNKFRHALEQIATVERAGAMEKMTNTWKGSLSMLQDAVFRFQTALGKELLPTLTDWLHKLTALAEYMSNLGPVTRGFIAWSVAGAVAVGSVATAIAGLVVVFGPLVSLLKGYQAARAAAALVTAVDSSALWANTVASAASTMGVQGLTASIWSLNIAGAASIGILGAIAAITIGGALWGADQIRMAAEEDDKFNDALIRSRRESEKLGRALDDAFKQGKHSAQELAKWLDEHGFTKKDVALGISGDIDRISELEAAQKPHKEDVNGTYVEFGGRDLTPAEGAELQRLRAKVAIERAAGAKMSGHAGDDGGGSGDTVDPDAEHKTAVKALEDEMKLSEQKLKLGEINEKQYRQELQQSVQKIEALHLEGKEEEQVNSLLIQSRAQLLGIDTKTFETMKANHKDAYGAQIQFVQHILNTEKLSAAQREEWEKKLAEVQKAQADSVAKAHTKALNTRFHDNMAHFDQLAALHKKDFDLQMAYLNRMLAMEGWSHEQRVQLRKKLAELEGEKTREVEAAAKKRTDIETHMHDEIVRILHGQNTSKEASLEKEVEAARKAGVSEVKIAEYVAAKRKELMEEAAKKAESLMAEMQEATLEATEGEIAGKIRKIAEKVAKLREMEKEMSAEDKAKAEKTITGYVGAEKQKLLEEEKDSIDAIGEAHKKAAEHAEKGASALHKQNQEATALHGTLERLGGKNSPLMSLAEMASGMNLFGSDSSSDSDLRGKNREFQRHHLSADEISRRFADLGSTLGGGSKSAPSAAAAGGWVNDSPGAQSYARATSNAAAAASGAPAGGNSITVQGLTITINGKTVSGDVKDQKKLKGSLEHLLGSCGIEGFTQGYFEGTP